jgi:ferredoxin-NADP reductase
MENAVKILGISQVTHDVKCFRMQRPPGYVFSPGQATDVSINAPGLEQEKRPFTFTGLATDPYLEFTIKRYKDHHGITDHLHRLEPGAELIIGEPWGAIHYTGPGYFIAGGAGITPFVAILRQLHKENKLGGNTLFFSNKTIGDIIYKEELEAMLGKQAIFTLTRDSKKGYLHEFIDDGFLKQHISDIHRQFYVCGPDPMVMAIIDILKGLGASPEALVFEK